MADNEFERTAGMMKAAMPYVDIKTKIMIDFFSKLFDLMECYQNLNRKTNLAACGYEDQKVNMEGLMSGIRPLCNDKDRGFLDQILNIFNVKRMFETYNTYMNAMKAMQAFEGSPFGSSESGSGTDQGTGNSSGFDFSSLFSMFGGNPGTDSGREGNSGFNFNNMFGSKTSTDSDNKSSENTSDSNSNENTSDSKSNGNTSDSKSSENTSDNEKTTDSASQTDYKGNNKMYDMLKTMIPPEQMSTYENLSMLFNTMSYANNSKSD